MFDLFYAAEEAAEESSGIDLLLPETSELIAGIIAFVIIFLVVWKWALPALNRTLEARQQAITGQLTAAENAKKEAESLLEDYKQQVAGARKEANQIVEDARQSGDALRDDIVSKAETEAEVIAQKARADAAAERERAASGIRDEVAALSLDVAQKVVSDSVDEDVQRDLVDRYIEDLGGMG